MAGLHCTAHVISKLFLTQFNCEPAVPTWLQCCRPLAGRGISGPQLLPPTSMGRRPKSRSRPTPDQSSKRSTTTAHFSLCVNVGEVCDVSGPVKRVFSMQVRARPASPGWSKGRALCRTDTTQTWHRRAYDRAGLLGKPRQPLPELHLTAEACIPLQSSCPPAPLIARTHGSCSSHRTPTTP